jgi:bifunctional UDP-N-acetylglucosamine pyrophosphorylase/glucosamine-1-phosphate N-acetyltransferase
MKTAAIVLAAGKGTRFKSTRPKVLHDLCGRPLGAWAVQAALDAGASPIVVVIGHSAGDVRESLQKEFPRARLRFAAQKEQLGTAHAVLAAQKELAAFKGRVLITSGDVPRVRPETLRRLAGSPAPLALCVTHPPDPSGYGRVVQDGGSFRIVEEKDADDATRRIPRVNAGLYAVDAAFLWPALKRIGRANAQREYYLTDLVAQAPRAAIVSAPFDEVAGVNDRAELARAAAALRAEINARWMREGVTLQDPANTYIDARSRIANDVFIGAGCVIENCEIAEGAQILAHSVLDGARVGARARVGPFARLRPGTVLGEDVHIGNFVEAKKALIGKGSKANHLTYLGDAIVGADVNVGAGAITCNYDGERKWTTVFEDGSFIGSDTQFVAPVKVGRGAYVGTGATIRKNVPPGALAVSSAPQRNIEGWVRKRKRRKGSAR